MTSTEIPRALNDGTDAAQDANHGFRQATRRQSAFRRQRLERSTMQRPSKYSAFLLLAVVALFFTPQKGLAESTTDATVNFGTFHGVNGGSSEYDNVLWSQLSPTPPPGSYSASSGNCINTSIGYLCAPQSINNITGHGTYMLQFSLAPNGQKGTISGSFNVNYGGQEPLELTVNYKATSD